jgi:hypothetical protein
VRLAAPMREMRNVHRISVGKPGRKTLLRRPSCRWADIVIVLRGKCGTLWIGT